jgi:hypothetical protein
MPRISRLAAQAHSLFQASYQLVSCYYLYIAVAVLYLCWSCQDILSIGEAHCGCVHCTICPCTALAECLESSSQRACAVQWFALHCYGSAMPGVRGCRVCVGKIQTVETMLLFQPVFTAPVDRHCDRATGLIEFGCSLAVVVINAG